MLEVGVDESTNQEFLKCEYNRDGESYRSCWSNSYQPASGAESIFPS